MKEFNGDHNHPLLDPITTQFVQSHRQVCDANKAQLDAMCRLCVKTSQIMNYMVQQSGGHQNVGFIPKDLCNHIDAMCRVEMKDDDAK